MSDTKAATKPKIRVERTYKARVDELWDLWTTKEGFESWWGPEGFRVEVHAIDPRVGGSLHYSMIADTPQMIEEMKKMGRPASDDVHGRFTELQRNERVVIAQMIDFVPGVAPYEFTMAAEFSASGGSVRMVVTFDPMHSEEFTKMSQQGFASQVSKLDKRFGTQRA
jgi:uncharacterized protein YndB with AHSA1/START domain